MKKGILLAALLIGLGKIGYCDWLTDNINAAFVGNAKLAVEQGTDGKSHPEFLDNFFEVGHLNGNPVGAVDLGISGTILPSSGALTGGSFTTGAKVHLASLIKQWVTLNPEWQFINQIDIDGRWAYNWTEHHGTAGIALAYPFK